MAYKEIGDQDRERRKKMEKELALLLKELWHLEIDDARLNRLLWVFEERQDVSSFIGTMGWDFFEEFVQKNVDNGFGVL